MMVFCNNITSPCCDSTIHELIVIRVSLNQIEIKIDIDKSGIWTTHYCINDVFCSLFVGKQA